MATSPQQVIDDSPMSFMQIVIVAIMVGLNGLDGFDVLAISFASPGIAAEWGIERGALGIVLSAELIGMAVGSLVLGGVADKVGRRPTMLGCLVVMTIGMFMASLATGIVQLAVWRVLTGLGIGGMLAAINAVAAEYSNKKQRNLCLSIMVIGYPLGAVIGGQVVSVMLAGGASWHAIFQLGAAATALFIPLVLFFVPESVGYLEEKRPEGALAKANAILVRLKHKAADALPHRDPDAPRPGLSAIFGKTLIATTMVVTFAYFAHILTFYYIIKWIPKIVVDMGYVPSSAANVLVMANIGGATGGAVFGLLTLRFGLKALTIGTLVMSTLAVIWFGRGASDIDHLKMLALSVGFFVNAGIVGLYAIVARAFPTNVRATGTGFVIGLGRGGAALSPIIAGFMFQAGMPLLTVSIIMGSGAALAGLALVFLKLRTDEGHPAQDQSNAA